MEEPNARRQNDGANYPCPDCGGPTRGEQNRKPPAPNTEHVMFRLRVCRTPGCRSQFLTREVFCARVPFTGPARPATA